MSEKFTQKWAIVSLLEEKQDGEIFSYTDFPLHVTLAGVFASEQSGQQLANGLEQLLIDQKPVEIKADEQAMFGPSADIAVMKLHKTPELMELYGKVYNWLDHLGAKYNSPEYQGDGFVPHSTFQKTGKLELGEIRKLNSVSIIDLFPGGDGYKRKIYKTIKF